MSKEEIAAENNAFQNTVQETLKSDAGLLSKGVGLFAGDGGQSDPVAEDEEGNPEDLTNHQSEEWSNTLIIFSAILCVIFILAFKSTNSLVSMTMAWLYNFPYGCAIALLVYKLGQFLYREHKGIKIYEDKVSLKAAILVFVMFFAGKMISGSFG